MPYQNVGSRSHPPSVALEIDERHAAVLFRVSRGAALLVCLLGLVGLMGWAFEAPLVKSVYPGLATMKANTAGSFLLSGLALLLLGQERVSWQRVGRGLSLVVAAIAILTLGQEISGLDLGIDGVLFQDPVPSAHPGRMSQATAAGFALGGLSILAIGRRVPGTRASWSEWLALPVGLVSLVALLGYAYDAPSLYAVGPFASMAVHTAFGFGLLSVAVLLGRPDHASARRLAGNTPGGTAARRLVPAVVIGPVVLGWLRVQGGRAGLYPRAFGTSLHEVATISLLGVLIWWTTAKLDRSDLGRRGAEERARRSEQQLRQAQKMEAVARLAGGVAHDFNNLLSVILSYSELVLEDLPSGAPVRPDLEQVRKAGLQAQALTRQLLLFSRQEVVEPRLVDLNDLISGMARMLPRLIGEDVRLETALGPSLGRIRADPGNIDQVLMNLVVNARDSMPGGGRVTIGTSNVTLDDTYSEEHLAVQPGEYVMLAVTDTGTGMDEDTRAQIFEPFFTTKERGKGTGLGLSTVFGIVQQAGGTIWVYSELGQGTTFKIYLPRADHGSMEPRARAEVSTLAGSERLLLVEDEEPVRAAARRILERRGYTVIACASPAEALALSTTVLESIDLLVSDVVMPGLSGPELASRLQARRPGLRVLFMSGYTDDAAVRHGLLASGAAFLQKPLTPASLAQKVREALDAA